MFLYAFGQLLTITWKCKKKLIHDKMDFLNIKFQKFTIFSLLCLFVFFFSYIGMQSFYFLPKKFNYHPFQEDKVFCCCLRLPMRSDLTICNRSISNVSLNFPVLLASVEVLDSTILKAVVIFYEQLDMKYDD